VGAALLSVPIDCRVVGNWIGLASSWKHGPRLSPQGSPTGSVSPVYIPFHPLQIICWADAFVLSIWLPCRWDQPSKNRTRPSTGPVDGAQIRAKVFSRFERQQTHFLPTWNQ